MTPTFLLVVAGLAAGSSGVASTPDLAPAERPSSRSGMPEQAQNKKTRVTCTLGIVRVDPPVDLRSVVKAPPHADRMQRNDLSPCAE
jgi:hypothetical protein